jgi:hypothetical protein
VSFSLEGCDLRGWFVRYSWSAVDRGARSYPLATASGMGYWHGDGTLDHDGSSRPINSEVPARGRGILGVRTGAGGGDV